MRVDHLNLEERDGDLSSLNRENETSAPIDCIEVRLRLPTGEVCNVECPRFAKVAELLPELIRELGFPTSQYDNYSLMVKSEKGYASLNADDIIGHKIVDPAEGLLLLATACAGGAGDAQMSGDQLNLEERDGNLSNLNGGNETVTSIDCVEVQLRLPDGEVCELAVAV